MSNWYDNHGQIVREQVRNVDAIRGIGWSRIVRQCRRCRGTRRVRSGITQVACTMCGGTGNTTAYRMVFTSRAYMHFKAKAVRVRQARVDRQARDRLEGMANFEQHYTDVLSVLREYADRIPAFERWLHEAEEYRYMTDERVTAVYRERDAYNERMAEQSVAQEEARRSAFLGSEGTRQRVTGTVRYYARMGERVTLVVITDEGNWVRYNGRASNLLGMYAGARLTMWVRVERPVNMHYFSRDGRRLHGVIVNGTRVSRPTQVQQLDDGGQ